MAMKSRIWRVTAIVTHIDGSRGERKDTIHTQFSEYTESRHHLPSDTQIKSGIRRQDIQGMSTSSITHFEILSCSCDYSIDDVD